ncbi:MAG: hypothetical protein PHP04_01340 [Bacteroidales bacterium]|nr:hypothetical protein [Bacteroidales bacterium]HPS49114.1 hypothetical protein [Bacteroidales bacterium]
MSESCNPVDQTLPVLFIGGIRILHFTEHGTGDLCAVAAIPVIPFIDSTVVQWTYFIGHMFNSPEGLTFDTFTTGATVAKEFTLGTNKSTYG